MTAPGTLDTSRRRRITQLTTPLYDCCRKFFPKVLPIGPLPAELLGENALRQGVTGVEHQPDGERLVLHHLDDLHVSHLLLISHRGDRTLVRLEHLDADPGVMRQDGAAPPPRPEGADRRDGEEG
jgi:hypothetical protein